MKTSLFCYFSILNIFFLSEILGSKIFNFPIGSLFIFKGMLFPSKNTPQGKTKIHSNNENIDNNNNTYNNDDIKEQKKIIENDKISQKRMNIGKEKLRKKKYFIYVDPLDDFGAASVARRKCAEAGENSVRVCACVCMCVFVCVCAEM